MQMPIVGLLFDKALVAAHNNASIVLWANSIGVTLYNNQIEIINNICDPTCRNLTILAARSGGKTFATALAAFKLCVDNPGYEVLFFAPKEKQSTRILDEIKKICYKEKDTLFKEVNWRDSNRADFRFFNGSRMRALSSGPTTQIEGFHCDLVVADEAHQIADSVFSARITPMLKASKNPKIVKIGISMFKGHFYESCHNPTWSHIVQSWDKCPALYNSGVIHIDGVDYPETIIKDMPLTYKRERFPNNPELHVPSENNISEEDFDTQYEMKWVDSINKFLTSADIESMTGTHAYMYSGGNDGEEYYFGLDLAGGMLINRGIKRDFSSLVVVRKWPDGLKEVVYCEEWQGSIVDQLEEIVAVINPTTGKFKCKFGAADYGSLGPAVVDLLMQTYRLPMAGIRYKASEPVTGMPYKTALFDNLFTELHNGYFKYPKQRDMSTNYILQKHLEEWSSLERKVNYNGTVTIAAPVNTDEHDDACNACVLAVWAADKMQQELRKMQNRQAYSVMSVPNISSETTALARARANTPKMPAHFANLFKAGR
jgi:hypothetical protein